MKIFIDSADLEEIKEAFSWGMVDGVTTNPSLIAKAIGDRKVDMENYIEELLRVAEGCPVSLEVDGELEGKIREEQMIKEARWLYQRFGRVNYFVNVKIPVNPAMGPEDRHQFDGLKAIKKLSRGGVGVNATLIMNPEQALLAAKAGARYISPFMGRIDDYVESGMPNRGIKSGIELLKEVVAVLKPYSFKAEVIAASVRGIEHVRESAKLGVDIATIPFKVLKEMMGHEKTYEGVKKFKEDMVPEYRRMLKS